MVVFAKLESGQELEYVLQPVDDHQATTAGIGRGLGETITARSTEEGEVIEYAGRRFKRIP